MRQNLRVEVAADWLPAAQSEQMDYLGLTAHLMPILVRMVGVSAKPVNRPILSLNRKPKSRVESALNPIDLTVLAEYHEQIESNLQRIERKNHRVWYSKPGEFGITCQGRQKVKGESIPLA